MPNTAPAPQAFEKPVENSRIIIIDDNQAIHNDFDKILARTTGNTALDQMEADIFGSDTERTENAGYAFDLDHALQGQAGYEMVKKGLDDGHPYALAFVDMRMPPGWDGLETIEWLWKIDPDLHIVICSAYSDHTWDQISKRLGFGDKLFILQKPFSEIEVLQLAHSLVEKRQRLHLSTKELQAQKSALAEEMARSQRMEQELVTAQRLKTIGQITTGIAHEINMLAQHAENNAWRLSDDYNNINKLLGLYRNLALAIPVNDKTKRLLTEINAMESVMQAEELEAEISTRLYHITASTNEMLMLSTALKEFDHVNQCGIISCDINYLINNILKLFKNEYQYIADIEINADDIPEIKCNAGDICHAIINVLLNALHAIAVKENDGADKGTIHITTSVVDQELEIKITDSGVGIPVEAQAHIFEPFYTTKTFGKGSGQGLAIARSIIENDHQGSIRFETREGSGTTFTIRLPLKYDSD